MPTRYMSAPLQGNSTTSKQTASPFARLAVQTRSLLLELGLKALLCHVDLTHEPATLSSTT